MKFTVKVNGILSVFIFFSGFNTQIHKTENDRDRSRLKLQLQINTKAPFFCSGRYQVEGNKYVELDCKKERSNVHGEPQSFQTIQSQPGLIYLSEGHFPGLNDLKSKPGIRHGICQKFAGFSG